IDGSEVLTFDAPTSPTIMDMFAGGGWIEGYVYDADGSLPLEDKIIIVKDSFNNIIGTYTSENNNVEEGHPANAGYYKLSAPTGDGYVTIAQEKDGTVISSTPGISVIAGAPTTVHINMQGIRDLSVSPTDITFTPSFPTEGDDITITATIHNDGDQGETNVEVKFYHDSVSNANLIGTSTITSIASGGVEDVTITWDNVSTGTYNIHVVVTSVAGEINTTNNQATTEMVVVKSAEETTSEAVALAIHPLYAADEIPFAVKVAVYGFPDGDYDVKVDITDKDGNRIGRIWNPAMSKWQSTFYYVNGVLVVNNGDGYYWACLKTSEYVGKATMVVTIRSNTTWKSGEYAMDIIGLDEGGWIEGSAAEDAIALVKDDGNVAGTCLIVEGSYKLFVPFGNYTLEVREKDGTLLSQSSISVSIPRDEGGEEEIDATITTGEETIPSDVGDRRPSPTQIGVEKSSIPMIYLLIPLLTGISVTALFILRKIRRFERL
ncbi:MAG: CARDB domain-containing protein, partial [Methanocellales archaeon]|nr:CARDB domain-containing protein [Methanocellales archaeon]